jgi:phosphatidylglycerol:prolipoprotein diacylglycerol transferase
MFPYLLRTDSGFIYTFTAVWIFGLALAGGSIYYSKRQFNGWDGLLAAGVSALLLGRIQFVWQNGEWFVENPAERWNVAQGGFGYAGVIFGGLLGLFLWGLLTQNKLRPILISLIPCVPLLHFIGWLACWFDGCGYGAKTSISWNAAPLPDNFGLITVRYQTQLGGMLLAVFAGTIFFLCWRFWFQNEPLQFSKAAVFWLALTVLSATRTVSYVYQGDTVPLFGALRADFVFALVVTIFSLTVLIGEVIYNYIQSKA